MAQNAEVRIARVAERQWGRISRRQLEQIGLSGSTISNWVKRGRLHRRLPGVYAVGHVAGSIEAELAEALLYAGPGAALSHTTAGWWRRLLNKRPATIHVSTPRRCRSLGAIRVFHRPGLERTWHRRFPTTPVPQILLELASLGAPNILRKALAQAEYQRLLKLADVHPLLGRGHKGSAALKAALRSHLPQLARTKSDLEDDFLFLCERYEIPIPEVNIMIAGWEVDASWPRLRVAVELDGVGNHGTQVAVARDRRKELALREAGLVVARYSKDQVGRQHAEIAADVIATLEAASVVHPRPRLAFAAPWRVQQGHSCGGEGCHSGSRLQ